jgi:Tfp pilus assembly protein PilV
VISRIAEQPFIGKLFTAPTTIALYTNICKAGLTPASVYEYFDKASNRSQRKIQEFAVSLLQYMVDNCTDEQITDICASHSHSGPSDFEPEEQSSEEEDDGFEFARDEASVDFQSRVNFEDISPKDIVTKNSILYSNGALIASSNPIRYARDMGTYLLNGITNPSKLVSDYKKAYERYTKEIAQIEKADLSARKGKDGDGSNVDMLRDQRISSVRVPTIAFPAWAHINTREHLAKFSNIPLKNIDASKIRLPMDLTQIDIDVLDVPEWVILLLFSGVGIYMAPNNLLTDRYYETVLALAAKGQLAFLIADDSINYGANYPFSHVVISDDMVSTMSINTMFQLLGRAGRVGKSYAAFGHLGPLGLQKLQNYIHGVEESGHRTEAINLEKAVEDMFANREIQAAKEEEARIEYEQRRAERLLKEKREAQRQAFLKEQQRELDEKRREEEEAQRISMAEFNRYRAPRPQEKRASTSSNWRSEPRREQSRTSRFGTSSGRWERGVARTSTTSSSSELEKAKQIIAAGKYLPPHLKKLAQQHNLL